MGRRALGAELTDRIGRELRDGGCGRERKDVIAVAREEIERRNRGRLVDGYYVRHRHRYSWNRSNGGRATSGTGTRAVVSLTVVRWSRVAVIVPDHCVTRPAS